MEIKIAYFFRSNKIPQFRAIVLQLFLHTVCSDFYRCMCAFFFIFILRPIFIWCTNASQNMEYFIHWWATQKAFQYMPLILRFKQRWRKSKRFLLFSLPSVMTISCIQHQGQTILTPWKKLHSTFFRVHLVKCGSCHTMIVHDCKPWRIIWICSDIYQCTGTGFCCQCNFSKPDCICSIFRLFSICKYTQVWDS